MLEALRILGVPGEKALYVGDSEVDYETAKRAGIACALVSWGFRDREFLRSFFAGLPGGTVRWNWRKLRRAPESDKKPLFFFGENGIYWSERRRERTNEEDAVMELLEERIRRDGVVKPGNVLKVDSFLNHQMDVDLF